MVDVVHSNFLVAFFVRLGTTSIGLFVSTAVNMLVFPPEYSKAIHKQLTILTQQVYQLSTQVTTALLQGETERATQKAALLALQKQLALTTKLVSFQEKDTFHPFAAKSSFALAPQKAQLTALTRMVYHLDNLLALPLVKPKWQQAEQQQLLQANHALLTAQNQQAYHQNLALFTTQFFNEQKQANDTSFLPVESLLLYEIIALYQQLPHLNQQAIEKAP